MGEWDLRRALIDWDWEATGLWYDNRTFAHTQRMLPNGTIDGPPRSDLEEAGRELAGLSEQTRADLKRWNLLGEELLGVAPPPDAEKRLPGFYAEKERLAELVANELGPKWTVSWVDADGIEHQCAADARE